MGWFYQNSSTKLATLSSFEGSYELTAPNDWQLVAIFLIRMMIFLLKKHIYWIKTVQLWLLNKENHHNFLFICAKFCALWQKSLHAIEVFVRLCKWIFHFWYVLGQCVFAHIVHKWGFWWITSGNYMDLLIMVVIFSIVGANSGVLWADGTQWLEVGGNFLYKNDDFLVEKVYLPDKNSAILTFLKRNIISW